MLRKSNQVGPEKGPSLLDELDDVEMQTLKTHGIDVEDMEDEEDQYEMLEKIKCLPYPMANKRRIRDKLFAGPVKGLGGCDAWKYHQKVQWRRCKLTCKEISYRLELWGGLLRRIEGHHGTGVLSYFVLLRWLFGLNILLFSLIFFFVIIPMAAFPATALSASDSDTAVNLSYYCSLNYSVVVSTDVFTLILDTFQGTGWMEKTMLFYGAHASTEVSFTLANYNYNLPLAYVIVAMAVLGISLILMGKSTAESVSQSVVHNTSDHSMQYCNKVFGAWDYTMTDDKSAVIKQKSIHYDIASGIAEQKFQEELAERLESSKERFKLYGIRILINCCVFLLLVGAGTAIYFTQKFSTEYTSTHTTADTSSVLLLVVEFLPSLIITILNGLLPLLFGLMVKAEDYTLEFVVKITLIRTVFLRLASLAVLIVTLYTQITCSTRDACLNILSPCSAITCWETYVGQQFYKLVVLDTLVGNIKVLLVEFPRRLLYNCCTGKCGLMDKIGPPEFDVAKNVLDLVYTQTLCWLGFFFSPLIPGIVMVSLLILFYMKCLSALFACQPSQRPYRAARSNSFFMVVLLIAFFLSCFPVGYTISSLEPSKMCGPFRTDTKMYEAITDFITTWPDWLGTIWNIVFSPAFTACIFVLLFLVIYYQCKVGNAHEDSSKMLKSQLQMEGRDKQFLLAKIKELTGENSEQARSKRVEEQKAQRKADKMAMKNGVKKPPPKKRDSVDFQSEVVNRQPTNNSMSNGLSNSSAAPPNAIGDDWD